MFNKKKIILSMGTLLVSASMLLAGCGGGGSQQAASSGGEKISGKISASGSTALLPLLKPAQEAFQDKYKDVTVNVAGGGSFTGMNQVAEGSVDIGDSDVNLPDEYKDKGLVDHKVVVEPFVFIVDKANKVDNLTKDQVIGILMGKITNWKEVGGDDQKITLIHRAKSSGSRATISDVVLKWANFTDDAVIQDSNGAVRAAIASTAGAIGYVDAAYADASVKMLAVDGVKYSLADVASGKYKILTFGRMFTKGQLEGATKAFIDFVTSKEFQESYAEKSGFVPLTKMPK